MKKSTGVLLLIIIMLLLGIIMVGGYFLVKENHDTDKTIQELKNEIVSLKATTEYSNIISTTNSISSDLNNNDLNQKTSSSIDAFSEKDLTIDQFKLGESAKAVVSLYGDPTSSESYTEGATAREISKLEFASYGLTVENETSDNDPDGSMIRITIHGTSTLQTFRGIKIGDSKEKILQSYPSNSILKNEENSGITVGYQNDDPIYETGKGKIYFEINNNKVSKIICAYGFAE